MAEKEQTGLPAGRPPWDPWNGARVGALTGGLLGALAVFLAGSAAYWVVPIGGAVGAAAGYWVEKRKQRPH